MLDNAAKGQIDSGVDGAFGFGDLVFPVHLCLAAHDQQGPVPQGEFDRRQFLAVFVFEQEAAGASYTQRGDGRLFAQFAFVVAVPAHAVLAVTITIEQDAVKMCLSIFFEASFALQDISSTKKNWDGKDCN